MTKGEKGGKSDKEKEPIDRMKERQELVESASDQFREDMLAIAKEYELSAAEVFFIVSQTLDFLSEASVQAEHEKYFGQGAEDDES